MRSKHATAHVVRTLLVLGLVIGPLIATPRHIVAAQLGTWEQQAPRGAPAVPLPLFQVQCPSTSVCYAVGSPVSGQVLPRLRHPILEKTTDGGVTWTSQQLDVDPYPNNSPLASAPLACPSVDLCYLLANTGSPPDPQRPPMIWVTEDGGRTWTKHKVGSTAALPQVALQQIVCPSTRVCYVSAFRSGQQVRENLLITRDGGATWASRTLTVTDQPIFALACPGIDDCYLSGFLIATGSTRTPGIAVTHDGGRTWAVSRSRDQRPPVYNSLSCPATNQCYAAALEGSLLVTQDGGRTWTKVTQHNLHPSKITCPTAKNCYAMVGSEVLSTADGGITWEHNSSSAGYSLLDLACPGPTTCYGVGFQGEVVKTSDGRTWHEPTPYTRTTLAAIACPNAIICYAVGVAGTVLTTTDGGATWVRRSSGISAPLTSIACPALLVCFAGGFSDPALPRSVLLRTTDGGQSWNEEKQVGGNFWIVSVACPRLTACFALTSDPARGGVFSTADGGRTWIRRVLPKTTGVGRSIACATVQWCVALVGVNAATSDIGTPGWMGNGWLFATTDGGRHWRRRVYRGQAFLSVSCPSPTQCYAGGFRIWLRSTSGGQAWTVAHRRFAGRDSVQSLSCTGPSMCWGLAVRLNELGGLPVRTSDGGRSWRVVAGNVPVPIPGISSGGLLALTCPRPTRCFAVGSAGLIMAYSP